MAGARSRFETVTARINPAPPLPTALVMREAGNVLIPLSEILR